MFQIFTTERLIEYCKKLKWTRIPKEIHFHHTWKPDHSNFNGGNYIKIQTGMRNSHMLDRGWSDIGQHLTLFPDGIWVTGRDFNRDPASVEGRNHLGFAIEMIGNFDIGHDKLEGKQLESAIKFSAFLHKQFKLSDVFHREYKKDKSCPGTGIDKNWFVGLINQKIKGDDKLDVQKKIYKIKVNDLIVYTQKELLVKDGSVQIPLREFANLLGVDVDYKDGVINIIKK